eukprot:3529009-Prymnesium_polylepis.1
MHSTPESHAAMRSCEPGPSEKSLRGSRRNHCLTRLARQCASTECVAGSPVTCAGAQTAYASGESARTRARDLSVFCVCVRKADSGERKAQGHRRARACADAWRPHGAKACTCCGFDGARR